MAHVKGPLTSPSDQSSQPIEKHSPVEALHPSNTTNYVSDTESESENTDTEVVDHVTAIPTFTIASSNDKKSAGHPSIEADIAIPNSEEPYETNKSLSDTSTNNESVNTSMEITTLNLSDSNQEPSNKPTKTPYQQLSKGDVMRVVLHSNEIMTVKLVS